MSTLVAGGGVAFFAATTVANVANFAFHVAMSRMLGPSVYGALGSLLGLVTVVTLVATALQAAVTQEVAERHGKAARGQNAPVSGQLDVHVAARRAITVGVAVFALVGALSPVLAGFVHLSSVVPVLLFGAFVAATAAAVVPQGLHMGRLRFDVVAVAVSAGAVVRLAAGPVLVAAGFGLDGAMVATLLSPVVSLVVLWWPLRAESALHRRQRPGGAISMASATLAVVALGGLSCFIGLDSFLARHYLPRAQSGYYAAAATAARSALFLPAAVGVLAFPRLAAAGGRGHAATKVIRRATVAVALLGGAAALVVMSVPHLVVSILFGHKYGASAGSLRILAASSAAVGVVTVWVYALLARRSRLAAVPWVAVAALVAFIPVFHQSVAAVAWVVFVVSAGLLIVAGAALRRSAGRQVSVPIRSAPDGEAPSAATPRAGTSSVNGHAITVPQ